MSRRFGGPGSGKVVPVEVAQQLLEQRDRLAAEVQKLRKRCDGLATRADSLEAQGARLRRELEELRQERRELLEERQALLEESEEKIDEEEIETLGVNQRERYEKRIARLNDDLDRLRERQGSEVATARKEERVRLMGGLTEVLDGVDRALDMIDEDNPWRQGLEAIQRQFLSYLRGEGAQSVGETGEKLDPRVHEAVMSVPSEDVEPGHIVEVKRPGLVLEDGTVVRSAQVTVARRP